MSLTIRNFILVNIFIFAGVQAAANDVLLLENFEDGEVPPEGWDSVVTVPDYTWQVEHRVGYVADGIYAAICPWQETETQDEWLIAPVQDLSPYSSAVLSFYWFGSTYFAPNANLHLMVSTDGSTYDDVWEIPYHPDGEGSHEWTFQLVDLSVYGGSASVYIGFRYYGIGGDSPIIDVITLTSGNLSVETFSFGAIKAAFE